MSRTIDEKIVQMQFDNREFERNVQTSMSTLDKLKQSLKLDSATKGLENVDAAAKKVNLSPISSGVEAVKVKFSAMEIMAVTALTNITNSVVNTGKRLVSSLTIDPVKMGFSEYETQINAVQTILANTESKGTTLKDVNKALDELNAYADKTIYNFTEMTRNIGTFTAAGTDLDTSVKAIQGIANLAAVSGSTSQQASTAMYQLSQALSSGTVKLMDWNSVVNAGMGGQVFQDALKETARIHGVEIDKMIESEGSFRETLKDGWLTSEILTETLHKFTLSKEDMTEAQIKENEAMLKAKGYTEEQIEAIFKLGKTATNAATKVKTFSQLMDTLKEAAQSGWTQTWEIIVGDFEEAKELFTMVSDTIGEMLNSSAQARNEMLQGWKDLGGRKALIEGIGNAFKAIMGIIEPIKESFREIFPRTTAKQLFDITESFKNFTNRFKEWAEASGTVDKIKRTFKGLFAVLDIIIIPIKAIASGLKTLLGHILPAGNGVLGLTASIGDLIVKFRDFLKSSDVFNKAITKITLVLGKVIDFVRTFVSDIANAIKGIANIDTSGVDKFSDNVSKRLEPLSKLGEGIKKMFQALANAVKKIAPIIYVLVGKIGEVLGQLGEKLSTAIADADYERVFDIINGLLTGGLVLALKNLVDSFSEISGIFEGFGDILNGFAMKVKAEALTKVATAIAILAASLLVLTLIDSTKLAVAIGAISTLFINIFTMMSVFNKTSRTGIGGIIDSFSATLKSKSLINVATAIAILAGSMLILSFAVEKMAKLDTEDLVKGLISVVILMSTMIATATILSKVSGKMTKGLTGLVVMAVAIRVLVGAVEKLGNIDTDKLRKGLIGVGVLLAELVVFVKLLGKSKMGTFKATGILILAAAMTVLAVAVKMFSEINGDALIRGLSAMAIVLTELVIFTKLTKNAKHVITTATGLTILAAAMLIFAKAISTMGNMDWEEIGKGLLTMAGALVIVVAALHLVPKDLISKSTGLVIMASALLILGSALTNMGGMDWEEIAKGLVALAGSLTIIAVALNFMKTAIPGALAMAIVAPAIGVFALALMGLGSLSWEEIARGLVAIAGVFVIVGAAGYLLAPVTPIILALSAAILLLGAGCLAVGAGILAFAAGLSALAVAGTAGAAALVVIVSSLIGLIPLLIKKIGEGIIAIVELVAGSMDSICAAITTVLLAVIKALTECIPPLIKCLGVLLDSLLEFIVKYVPKIVDAGMKLILGLLKGVADNIDEVVAEAINVVVNFINGIASKIPDVIQSGVNLIISFINGIANAIRNNTKPMIDAVDNLMDAALEAVGMWFEDFREDGKNLIDGLIEGVKGAAKDLWNAMLGVVEDAWDGVKDFFGIHSPATAGIDVGMFIDKGLAVGLEKFAGVVGKSATNVGETAMDSLSEAISGVSEMVSDDMDSTPVITPVIDLTEIQNGEKQLSRMLGKDHTISVNSANIKAASISSGRIAATSGNNANNTAQQGAQFSFTQNNYSPKALSRSDIYRQTKNQFSAMKGALVGS